MRLIAYQRSTLALLLIVTLLATGLVGSAPRTAQAADGWSSAEQLTNDEIALFPDIVIDSQNVTHIVYTQTPDFNTSRIVRYINNRGGSWSAPFTLSAPGLFADLGRLSTVTINGQVNLAVVFKAKTGKNDTSRIYYRLSSDGGSTWGPQEQISNVASYEPAVLLDDTGQPHVLFTHNPGSTLDMAYVTKVNGTWTAPVLINTGATKFNRDASLGYTRSNGTLTLHATYMGGASGDEGDKHIFTTRKVGAGGWEAPRQRLSNSGGGFPELVTDFQSKVYGVWQVSSSAYFYEPYFARSLDNGANWTTSQAVGSLTGDIGQVPSIARTPSGVVAVLWEDEYRTSDKKRDVFARVSADDGANWSDVQNISPSPGYSRNIAAAANAAGFQAVWHDERKGSYQIYRSLYNVGGGGVVTGPSATPLLDSGLPITRNSVVAVSFSNVTGSPDGVRYHWDSAPTDADPWVAFTSPLTVQGPTGVTAAACQPHILYTQVRKSTTVGAVAQDSEIFDIGVQANVNILNRHLAGLPTTYSLSTQDVFTGPGGNGASDGDPNYTRERSFYLGISGFADCSGLSTFAVTGSESGNIANNFYANAPALPGGIAPGAHEISVEVKDALGNADTIEKTLIYDPANLDTTGSQTNTLGLPVLGSGGSVAANNANSIIRSLSFQGISVTDNLYGQQPNLPQLPSGKQFWGVWMANTTSANTSVDDPSLNWYPVRVATPDSNFTVTWNIFAGLNVPYAELRNRPGTYYVFVRFLDGAGNASVGSLKATVTLTAGYDVPTVRLSALAR
jgi:hypothetical protein